MAVHPLGLQFGGALPGGINTTSPDVADSVAANAAYDAAVESHAADVDAFDAAFAADAAAAAEVDVRRRLDALGAPAAVSCCSVAAPCPPPPRRGPLW